MIPESEWKFFEATEQRIKHLARHQAEDRLALLMEGAPAMDPEARVLKQAEIVQELDYPARVEQAIASEPDPDQARRLDLHRRWILMTLFETHPEIGPLLANLRLEVARFVPKLGDRETTWAELRRVLREEDDAELREAAWHASSDLAETIVEPMQELLRLREALARAVVTSGFPQIGYHALDQERTEIVSLLDEFERTTRASFDAMKVEAARALGEHALDPWDLTYAARRLGLLAETAFPAEAARDAIEVQLRRWGFEPQDLALRPVHKDQPLSGVVVPVDIPNAVRVVLPVDQGAAAYTSTFNAYGRAVYYRGIAANRHLLERESPIIPEAVGALFASVLDEPGWLEEQTGAPAAAIETHLRARRFQRLLALRLDHARTSFENIVYAQRDADPHRLYGDVFEQVLGWTRSPRTRWSGETFLIDEPFHPGSRILGELAAAQFRAHLRGAHPTWWREEATGRWLTDNIFAPGGRERWSDKIEHATGSALSIEAARTELGAERFRGPVPDEADGSLSDEAVDDYFKDIDLSDVDTD